MTTDPRWTPDEGSDTWEAATVGPEQLLRSALELAMTDLDAAHAHAGAFVRSPEGGYQAIRAVENITNAKRLIEQLLEENSHV